MKTSETVTESRYESITTRRRDNTPEFDRSSQEDQRKNLKGTMEMPNQVQEVWTFIGKVVFGGSRGGTLGYISQIN